MPCIKAWRRRSARSPRSRADDSPPAPSSSGSAQPSARARSRQGWPCPVGGAARCGRGGASFPSPQPACSGPVGGGRRARGGARPRAATSWRRAGEAASMLARWHAPQAARGCAGAPSLRRGARPGDAGRAAAGWRGRRPVSPAARHGIGEPPTSAGWGSRAPGRRCPGAGRGPPARTTSGAAALLSPEAAASGLPRGREPARGWDRRALLSRRGAPGGRRDRPRGCRAAAWSAARLRGPQCHNPGPAQGVDGPDPAR